MLSGSETCTLAPDASAGVETTKSQEYFCNMVVSIGTARNIQGHLTTGRIH